MGTVISSINVPKIYKADAGNSLTGTLTETILQSIKIPANTFNKGNLMTIRFRVIRTGATAAITEYIKINTSAAIAGATTMATYTHNTSALFAQIKREALNSTLGTEVLRTTAATITDDDASQASASDSLSIDWTVDQYIIVSAALGNIADAVVCKFITSSII